MPGVSTAEQVTDISGRGVGMDVVKTTIHSLGGSVSVISRELEGTEVTLSIPSTLGIETVLLIESLNKSYAVPINYIVETLKMPADKFKKLADRLLFYYRGEILMAFYLEHILEPDLPKDFNFLKTNNKISIVIIKNSYTKFGVIIDKFDKNMEIAVKPISSLFGGLDIISGVSILGNGNVLLVINPDKLISLK